MFTKKIKLIGQDCAIRFKKALSLRKKIIWSIIFVLFLGVVIMSLFVNLNYGQYIDETTPEIQTDIVSNQQIPGEELDYVTLQEAYKSSLTFDTRLDDSTEWVYYDCYVSIYPQIFIF